MSFSAPSVQPVAMPTPSATALSPAPVQGSKPGRKNTSSTFIGQAQMPGPGDTSKKTLLGQ